MSSLYKKTLVSLFLMVFIILTGQLFGIDYITLVTLGFASIFLAIILIIPSISSKNLRNKKKNDEQVVLDKDWQAGEYHNDFNRVGSSDDPK